MLDASVTAKIADLKIAKPDARVFRNPSIRQAFDADNPCDNICYPDLAVVKGDAISFYEIKTGGAGLTTPQRRIFPNIKNGTARLTAAQATRFKKTAGMTLRDAFRDTDWSIIVIEYRGPGYKD